MQPLSQAVLLEAFEPQDRGKAMGFWGLGVVAAPILGPVLGGWLTDNYSWRWVFYINIPVGIAARDHDAAVRLGSVVSQAPERSDRLHRHRPARHRHLDAAGRARQGAAGRLVLVPLHRRDAHRRDRVAGRLRLEGVDHRAPGRRSARVQELDLLARPGDHRRPGPGPLRQPRAAAGHAADADGIPAAAGRHRHGAARHGLVHRDAARRPRHPEIRRPQAGGVRPRARRLHELLAVVARPDGRAIGICSGRSSSRGSRSACCSCR